MNKKTLLVGVFALTSLTVNASTNDFVNLNGSTNLNQSELECGGKSDEAAKAEKKSGKKDKKEDKAGKDKGSKNKGTKGGDKSCGADKKSEKKGSEKSCGGKQ